MDDEDEEAGDGASMFMTDNEQDYQPPSPRSLARKREVDSEIQEDVRTLLWQDKIRITLPKGFSEIEISLIYLDYLDFKKRSAIMLVLIKKLIKQ